MFQWLLVLDTMDGQNGRYPVFVSKIHILNNLVQFSCANSGTKSIETNILFTVIDYNCMRILHVMFLFKTFMLLFLLVTASLVYTMYQLKEITKCKFGQKGLGPWELLQKVDQNG